MEEEQKHSNQIQQNLLAIPSSSKMDRKDTAYLRTLTQNTGDNPQDMGGEEGGESSEYESFEDEVTENQQPEAVGQLQSFSDQR